MGLLEKAHKKRSSVQPTKKSPHYIKKLSIVEASITTNVDKLLQKVKNNGGKIKLEAVAKQLGVKTATVETWIKTINRPEFLFIHYPTNIFSGPNVELVEEPEQAVKKALPDNKELLESYTITADFVPAKINIWNVASKERPLYELELPELGEGTKALVAGVMKQLAQKISIDSDDVTDPNKVATLKRRFFLHSKKEIIRLLPSIDKENANIIAGMLIHKMYGLDKIENILADNWLEEIAINSSKEPLTIYHRKYGWCETTEMAKSEEEIYNKASQVGRKVNREINSLNPIMDAHLLSGDRVAATLFPISTSGNTITIRRFARNPWTIIHLIDPKVNCLTKEMAALLWQAVQYELNILVAGGTASGKTSLLNAICSLIPSSQRIISIEDTREITLPSALKSNWVPMTTRNPNPEGKGAVTMLDLMVASLRMRPDRLIVGEVRRQEQAETMFESMHTGHAVYSTIHADTVAQVQRRLVEEPIGIPATEVEALHLVVVQYRDRKKGTRRTLEIAEVLSGEDEIEVNYLYRWRPLGDVFESANESLRLIEELNLHTGMTPTEIQQDLQDKTDVLQWMLKRGIKDVDDVGQIVKVYYKNPKKVLEAVKQNKHAKSILYK